MTTPVPAAGTMPTAARRRDSVRVRHEELTAHRRRLSAGPRADVAVVLELARSACREELTADLARTREHAVARIARARPSELSAVPAELSAAVSGVGDRLERSVAAHADPGLRRLAARLCPGAEPLPLPSPTQNRTARLLATAAGPGPASRGPRAVLSDPRLFGALAGIPVLALHGIGPSTALVLAGSVLLVGCLARVRTVADDRTRHREHVVRVVDAAATAGERELHRRLVATEAAVVAALERAVPERRGRIDAELTVLAVLDR